MIKISQTVLNEIIRYAKNNSYSNIIKDVKNSNIQLAVLTGTLIYKDGEVTLYKIRIANSNNNKGKRGGYRVLVLKKDSDFFILKVYPKTGVYGKENISNEEIISIIKMASNDSFIEFS